MFEKFTKRIDDINNEIVRYRKQLNALSLIMIAAFISISQVEDFLHRGIYALITLFALILVVVSSRKKPTFFYKELDGLEVDINNSRLKEKHKNKLVREVLELRCRQITFGAALKHYPAFILSGTFSFGMVFSWILEIKNISLSIL